MTLPLDLIRGRLSRHTGQLNGEASGLPAGGSSSGEAAAKRSSSGVDAAGKSSSGVDAAANGESVKSTVRLNMLGGGVTAYRGVAIAPGGDGNGILGGGGVATNLLAPPPREGGVAGI